MTSHDARGGTTARCYAANNGGVKNVVADASSSTMEAVRVVSPRADTSGECGLMRCRPGCVQHLASIKVFVLLLSLLVTLQQALSSGYLNSVITTIEKRYEIPSSLTGVIASFYEIGNMLTVIFVSYLGSRRHAPVWIGWGVMVMGVGSLLFALPHFITDAYSDQLSTTAAGHADVCRPPGSSSSGGAEARHHSPSSSSSSAAAELGQLGLDGLGKLAEGINDLSRGLVQPPPLTAHNSLHVGSGSRISCRRPDAASDGSGGGGGGGAGELLPVLVFMVAQLLLGSGGSPLFTLGTTYIDDHVPRESSSFYIGCMYSMVAFGPVLGFLLGAYMLSHHVDAVSHLPVPEAYDTSHPQWVGMWWGGFIICGIGMFLLGFLFFLFPKSLEREKLHVRAAEKAKELKRMHRHATTSLRAPTASGGADDPLHSLHQHHHNHHHYNHHHHSQRHRSAGGHRRTASHHVDMLRPSAGGGVSGGVVVVSAATSAVNRHPGHRRTLSSPTDQEFLCRLRHVTNGDSALLHRRFQQHQQQHQRHASSSSSRNLHTGASQAASLNKAGVLFSSSSSAVVAAAPAAGSTSRHSFRRSHRRTRSNMSQMSRASRGDVMSVGGATGMSDSHMQPSDYGKDVKDLPRSMWKLLCNPIYVVTCLGACMELMIVSGFIVFLPKYLETQFNLGKSEASVFAGGIAIPGACLGVFMGGYILKRLQLRPRGAVQFILLFQLICLAMYSVLFVVGCDNVKMAGATAPYTFRPPEASIFPATPTATSSSSSTASTSSRASRASPSAVDGADGEPLFRVNLTSTCNFGCDCDPSRPVEPVCGTNGLTYFSACHAGCTAYSAHNNYTNCACIGAYTNSSTASSSSFAEITVVPVATPGPCSRRCSNALPFMVLLFFMTFVVAITQMPLLMIVLRSVDEEERSFALGMQFVIFRLFAYIPSPILFGNVIDSTCVLWRSVCGASGRCLLYDIEVFRFRYVGICAGLKVLSALIFVFDWFLVRYKYRMDMAGTMTVGDIVNSIVSIDRGYREADDLDDSHDDDEEASHDGNHDQDDVIVDNDDAAQLREYNHDDRRSVENDHVTADHRLMADLDPTSAALADTCLVDVGATIPEETFNNSAGLLNAADPASSLEFDDGACVGVTVRRRQDRDGHVEEEQEDSLNKSDLPLLRCLRS